MTGALRRTADEQGFAVLAYCIMPDHFHGVLEGRRANSDVVSFVHAFKQHTSFWFKQQTGRTLWQSSFHDHILRTSESTRSVVRYVLENPVRAKLAESAGHYPHSGSLIYTRGELMEWAFGASHGEE